jgi:hypothetical protein
LRVSAGPIPASTFDITPLVKLATSLPNSPTRPDSNPDTGGIKAPAQTANPSERRFRTLPDLHSLRGPERLENRSTPKIKAFNPFLREKPATHLVLQIAAV